MSIYLQKRSSITNINYYVHIYNYTHLANLVHNHEPRTKALSNKKGKLLLIFGGLNFFLEREDKKSTEDIEQEDMTKSEGKEDTSFCTFNTCL